MISCRWLSGLSILVLLFLFHSAPPPCLAAEPAGAAGPYDQALERAEEDLRRMKGEEEKAGGWGLAEALSVVALAAALALMLAATRWTRGMFRRASGREMRLLDRMALGRNSNLLLVRLRGRDYWLSEAPNAITLLADWPSPEEEAPAKPEKGAGIG